MSKLGTVLTVIFVVSLAALLAELFYVLWRRRAFRRQTTGGLDQLSQNSSTESNFSPIASSKELLYLFCIRPQSRIERNAIAPNSDANGVDSNREEEMEVIDIDLLKISGPPRFLFTIKEEEKEDMESPLEIEVKKKKKRGDRSGIKRVSLEECMEDAMVAIAIDDATPFSTPCDSPLYFTPADSPVREVVVVDDRSTGDGGVTVVMSSQV